MDEKRICSKCGTEIPEGFNFCGKCGTPYVALVIPKPMNSVKHCPKCGNEVISNERFCGECGNDLIAIETTISPNSNLNIDPVNVKETPEHKNFVLKKGTEEGTEKPEEKKESTSKNVVNSIFVFATLALALFGMFHSCGRG
jgi:NMD protein affecting ribosome stability and mRNA decay